jgi:hypothetical protein
MLEYNQLRNDRRKVLTLTGLTLFEFQQLLPVFTQTYKRLYAGDLTVEGEPRQRIAGGGRSGALHPPEQKLLFILVYLKTYPLQVIMAELFGLSQPRVNYWIHRLLPVLRETLDQLGVLPERDPQRFAQGQGVPGEEHQLIIDGTERRRQRPKNPEKQALHYSGKKKTHSDKNVVVVDAQSNRLGYLSQTHAGKTHEKKIAEGEQVGYPPGTVLYKDTGFQGYEPTVKETRQAKKKAEGPRTHRC